MQQQKRNTLISLVGLLLVGGIVFISIRSNTDTSATKEVLPDITTDTGTAPIVATPSSSASASGYTDGTYSAEGQYRTPESIESIKVTLTLQNGIVSDANVSISAHARESARYQQMFAANYREYVIGKNIADLKLARVSGSSLTPLGFNDAVAKIKSLARA